MAEIQLKKFDITQIKDDKVVVLIGKRETGKSFLCKDILYHHSDIPIGQVISGTEAANCFYGSIVPKIFIHDKYSDSILKNMLKRQRKMIKALKQNTTLDPRSFLILDDCLYDKSWQNSEEIRTIFMNGRHYKLLFLLTMQYALGISPQLRTNIDYVFLLRENYVSNRKRLYEHYAGMFPTFDMFCQVMDQCTENYECLVIHNNAKSNRLDEQVFWYKAEPRCNFKMCSDVAWKYSEANCKDDEDSDDENSYQNNMKKRKERFNIVQQGKLA
jgi:hypothetical protein